MNERIKELAEQAGMSDDKFGMFFAKDFDSHCADGVDLEKFAELIIRECTMACEKNSHLALNGWQRAKQIKEHFGIEE